MMISPVKKLQMVVEKLFSPAHAPEKIFTLPGYSLPSQYRSLLPTRESEAQELVRLERSSRNIRNAVIGLVALLIVVVIGTASIIVATLFHFHTEPWKASQGKSDARTHLTTMKLLDIPAKDQSLNAIQVSQSGSQCRDRCWEFSAFKYSAACEQGRCRCHSSAYQEFSCLPRFGRCNIVLLPPRDNAELLQVLFNQEPQPVYACSVSGRHGAGRATSVSPKAGPVKTPTDPTEKNIANDGDASSVDLSAQNVESSAAYSLEGTQNLMKGKPAQQRVKKPPNRFGDFRSDRMPEESRQTRVHDTSKNLHGARRNQETVQSSESSAVQSPQQEESSQSQTSSGSQHVKPANNAKTSNDNLENLTENAWNLKRNQTTFNARHPKSGAQHGISRAAENLELKSTLTRIHVISVQGGSGQAITNVTVHSSRKQRIVFALASYGARRWNLVAGKNIEVEKIVLISNHRISGCSVTFLKLHKTASEDDSPLSSARLHRSRYQPQTPTVTRKLLRTGYGDDRVRGSTPQLLQSITKTVGEIDSFIGVAHAESLSYDADFELF